MMKYESKRDGICATDLRIVRLETGRVVFYDRRSASVISSCSLQRTSGSIY